MTKVKYWYHSLNTADKAEYREYMQDFCGISEESVYRYLDASAPKLTKAVMAEYCKIPISDLYLPAVDPAKS